MGGEWAEKYFGWVRHKELHLKKTQEILYDGMYYDVTNFIAKHPGGSVIEIFADSREDATIAVQQFHNRSIKKVLAIMKTLPHRKANEDDLKLLAMDSAKHERHKALTADFLELFQTFQKEGLFTPNPFHVLYRSIEVFLLLALGVYVLRLQPLFLLPRIFGIFALGLGMGRGGWLWHESGHHSLIGIPKFDRLFNYFFLGFINGLSRDYWRFQHSHHHAAPQHVKYDTDLDSVPMFASNKRQLKKPGLDTFGLMKYQRWMFIPVHTLLIMIAWRFARHPYHCVRNGKWFDIALIAFHTYFFISSVGFTNYWLAQYFVSAYLLVSILMSHSHLPETEEPTHWVEFGLTHSANIRSSWWVDYWMGYLNYQIEHHLFPTMPQYKNKLCRDRIKALAKKHNLPYHLYSFGEALVIVLDNLGDVSKEL